MKHFQIQNLSDDDRKMLNDLKDFFGYKTISKSVMEAVELFPSKSRRIKALESELSKLENELSSLRSEIGTYFGIEKSLRSEGDKY